MRLPIAGFALGVGWLQSRPALPDVPELWAAGAFGGAALAAVAGLRWSARRSPGRAWWLRGCSAAGVMTAGAVAGLLYAAWAAEHRMADALPPRWEGADITITGIVSGLPTVNQSDDSVRFGFDVERASTAGAVVPGRIALAWYGAWRGAKVREGAADAAERPPELHAGERWQLTVRLRRPHGNANPHGFDLEAWMLENGLRASGYVRRDPGNRRLDPFAGRWMDRIDALRERIRARIVGALDGRPYAGVIVALTIGDQRSVSQAQWQLYNRTGVSHLLSISGLHVTLFATLLGGAVYGLWRRSHVLTTRLAARKAAALLGALAAFGYVLLAGFEVPAQRTLYMLAVGALGLWIGRPGSGTLVLAWALAVVLVLDPWAVLAAGFWLSFGAVALLMYAGGGRLSPGGGGPWWLAAGRAQWAITVGMLPMMLALFQQVSLVSPLANALAIPVVGMVVVPMALLWLVIPWDFILVAAHALFAWVAAVLTWLDALPAAVWAQHAPPPWAVAAGMAGVLLLLAPRGMGLRWPGLAFVLPLFLAFPERPPPGALWLEVLDVGQGLAVLAQTRDHALLYDAGPRFSDVADAGNRIVAPYLRARGIARLDGLVITHQDADHSGGAQSVLASVPVGWVLSSLDTGHRIAVAARAGGSDALPCAAGQRWEWDGVGFAVLHPRAASLRDPGVKSNDRGCVLRIDTAHGSVLLTGDIEARSEAELLGRGPALLRSDVLQVPHHGSKTSSTPAFIAAVGPRLAIATPGYRNRLGHPRPEILERYRAQGVPLLRSDYDGAVQIRFERGTFRVRTWRQTDERYWRDRPRRDDAGASD
jgi:competence protein ComEC